MGVKDAFDAGDFGYMAEGLPLRVSGVKHKATVEVTVQGTEGAAATGSQERQNKYSLTTLKNTNIFDLNNISSVF